MLVLMLMSMLMSLTSVGLFVLSLFYLVLMLLSLVKTRLEGGKVLPLNGLSPEQMKNLF